MAQLRPMMPHRDPDQLQRREDLAVQQRRFQYSAFPEFLQRFGDVFNNVKFPILHELPQELNFSRDYTVGRIMHTAPILTNQALLRARGIFDPLDKLEDYDDIFIRLPKPDIVKSFKDDHAFAEQRLSGVNPVTLSKLPSSDSRAKVLERITDPAHAQKAKAALESGRCFVVDYTGDDPAYTGPALLEERKRGGTPMEFDKKERRKWLPRPLAFFEWETDTERLMPLAIEVTRGGRVFIPKDTRAPRRFVPGPLKGLIKCDCDDWFFAKLCLNTADTMHHEMSTHLGRVHFTCEPIAVSMHRHLHKSHPLRFLLDTHTRFHLCNNNSAHDTLLGDGGAVNHLFPGTLTESLSVAHQAVRTWNIRTMSFNNEFEARGVADTDVLPHYPFRDDGKLVWDALNSFVQGYLKHFYPTDNDVKKDKELQAWASELQREDGGYVGGFPSSITTLELYTELVTTIIFHLGPFHSAVNFLQFEYEALCSNMPCASYVDPDELSKKEHITRKDIMKMLPPWGAMIQQFDIMFFLSCYRYDTLGYYDKSYKDLYGAKPEEVFEEHPAVIELIKQLQEDLEAAEHVINERNKKRKVKYNGMLPSRCLNSTSI